MLLIQKICLQWDKSERGGKFAECRSRFPLSYKVPDYKISDEKIIVNRQNFYQIGIKIMDLIEFNKYIYKDMEDHQLQHRMVEVKRIIKEKSRIVYSDPNKSNIPNTHFSLIDGVYKVRFFEGRKGQFYRRGHNEDFLNKDSAFYYKDILNETAFNLKPGEYGRIIYNERNMYFDTGNWYYKQHIINIINYIKDKVPTNIYLSEPDHLYSQMVHLF